MNLISTYLNDFLSLFFPQLCGACGTSLVAGETAICTSCVYHLPRTNFHLIPDNTVARQFWGRFPFISCDAFLFFSKGKKVQHLLHQLKYNNQPEVGRRIGELYAAERWTKPEALPDIIIPVPLHPRKLKQRGYNQSALFAEGISQVIGIPFADNILKRVTFTNSQTKKGRFARYENMKEVFQLANPDFLVEKHVLLVDDVITTGATIEACAEVLLKVEGLTLSIAGLAFTGK